MSDFLQTMAALSTERAATVNTAGLASAKPALIYVGGIRVGELQSGVKKRSQGDAEHYVTKPDSSRHMSALDTVVVLRSDDSTQGVFPPPNRGKSLSAKIDPSW